MSLKKQLKDLSGASLAIGAMGVYIALTLPLVVFEVIHLVKTFNKSDKKEE